MRAHCFAAVRLAMADRSVFVWAWPYRLARFGRSVLLDAALVAPLLGAGIWWAVGPGDSTLPAGVGVDADDLARWLLDHQAPRYLPLAVALCFLVILIRHDARRQRRHRYGVIWRGKFRARPDQDRVAGSGRGPVRIGGIDRVIALVFGLLAAVDLAYVPSTTVGKYAPFAVAALWGWFARNQVLSRIDILMPTAALFRPPVKMVLTRSGRDTLSELRAWHLSADLDRDRIRDRYRDLAHQYEPDPRVEAWCLARIVDLDLGLGDLEHAEATLATAEREASAVLAEPAFRAAKGLFLQAVGRRTAAGEELRTALAGTRQRATRVRLRALIRENEQDASSTRRVPVTAGRESRWALVWWGEHASVLFDVLSDVERLARSDRERAGALATTVAAIAERLTVPDPLTGMAESRRLAQVRVTAVNSAATTAHRLGRLEDAAALFETAWRLHFEAGDLANAGVARARAAAARIEAGCSTPMWEDIHLDNLRTGLQMIEDRRGLLRDNANREVIVQAYEEHVYVPVLQVLSTQGRHHLAKAAQLALWLLESTRRNAIADAMRDGVVLDADSPLVHLADERQRIEGTAAAVLSENEHEILGYAPTGQASQWSDERHRALREEIRRGLEQAMTPRPVDLATSLRLLGNRVAIYYHCHRDRSGWQITTLLISPSGIRLDRKSVPVAERSADGGSAWQNDPGTVLDRITAAQRPPVLDPQTGAGASGSKGSEDLVRLHNRAMFRPQWHRLAEALLPAGLREALARTSRLGGKPVLVILPDGPLCALPFAGLRLPGTTSVLAQAATVVHLPSLAMLEQAAAEEPDTEADGGVVVVANLGETHFQASFDALVEQQRTVPEAHAVMVRATTDRESLRAALETRPRPAVAVVSNHGRTSTEPYEQVITLQDGKVLSSTGALAFDWPRTVILDCCWATRLVVTAGAETFGFPIACLLRGADIVIGSQAPVYDDAATQGMLAQIVLRTAYGSHAAEDLGKAMADLAETRAASLPAPAAWAGLTCWATRLPTAPAGPNSDLPLYWTPLGASTHRDSAMIDAAAAHEGLIPNGRRGLVRPKQVRAPSTAQMIMRTGRFGLGYIVLVAWTVTASLHGLSRLPSTSTLLREKAPQLIGELATMGRSPRPATLMGALSTFYTPPYTASLSGELAEAAHPHGPPSLSSWYVFAVPGEDDSVGVSAATLRYRGSDYDAELFCADQSVDAFCLAAAVLPAGAAPAGFAWHPQYYPSSYAGSDVSADILARSGPLLSTEQATVNVGKIYLTIYPTAGDSMVDFSPVVPQGFSAALPLVGLVSAHHNDNAYQVLPVTSLMSNLRQIANWHGGYVAGSLPDVGLAFRKGSSPAVVAFVAMGGPADYAGLRNGDQIAAIDNHPTPTVSEAVDTFATQTPNSRVPFTVVRAGQTLTVNVRLGFLIPRQK
jgi:hypothetical protein